MSHETPCDLQQTIMDQPDTRRENADLNEPINEMTRLLESMPTHHRIQAARAAFEFALDTANEDALDLERQSEIKASEAKDIRAHMQNARDL